MRELVASEGYQYLLKDLNDLTQALLMRAADEFDETKARKFIRYWQIMTRVVRTITHNPENLEQELMNLIENDRLSEI